MRCDVMLNMGCTLFMGKSNLYHILNSKGVDSSKFIMANQVER